MLIIKHIGYMKVKNCWLTINRACNLRCEWCYAQETKFQKGDDMPFNMVTHLIDMCVSNGIMHYVLIGGEPTIHPDFFEIIEYIISKNCKTTIVTNGILLANDNFAKKMIPYADSIHLSISLKGSTNQYYKEHCGAAVFDTVKQGISNCKCNKLRYSLSYVISAENVNTISAFAQDLRSAGIQDHIAFSFCNEIISPSGEFENIDKSHPLIVNKILNEHYNQLNEILGGNFSLHQNLPLCMCDNDVINIMKNRKQIATSCHVHNREGIIFDTNGSILLCNHFVGYGVGTYGKDYYDAITLARFWNSEQMIHLHRLLTSMPSENCRVCELQKNCGGGCCIQWFSQNFEQYKKVYNSIINNSN